MPLTARMNACRPTPHTVPMPLILDVQTGRNLACEDCRIWICSVPFHRAKKQARVVVRRLHSDEDLLRSRGAAHGSTDLPRAERASQGCCPGCHALVFWWTHMIQATGGAMWLRPYWPIFPGFSPVLFDSVDLSLSRKCLQSGDLTASMFLDAAFRGITRNGFLVFCSEIG
jgi:hypothetical protein